MPLPKPKPSLKPSIAPAPPFPGWAAVCFLASGAAGLLYEVVWSKQLAYLLGGSLHAVATVVAAFLAGLALGARVIGAPLSRRGQGPRIYAMLELAVGALGIALLPLLRGLEPVLGTLYRSLGGEGPAFAAARFALLVAVLVPPAALMGATLPVLVGHFERDRVGTVLARLYALNTLGAVAGSLAGGFVLLPGIGLSGATGVAVALNVAVAAVAWRAGRGTRPVPPAVEQAPRAVAGELGGGTRGAFAVLFALSGFTALVFQIVWVRLFGLIFGSSVYSFSAVLGVYLFGIAIGSAAIAGPLRRGATLSGFAKIELGIAVAAALMLHAFPHMPQWTFDLATHSGPQWSAVFVGQLGITAWLLILPCALFGAAFPIATRLLQSRDGGHATGFAYAVNTAGTIAGSLVAGFWAVPSLGVRGTHLGAVLASVGIGLAALVLARARREARGADLAIGLAAAAVAVTLGVLSPPWDPALMSSGVFRPVQASQLELAARLVPGTGSIAWRGSRTERVLYYHEGINASVLVGTDEAGKDRWLRVGGKIDASLSDMETQVLLGLLPAVVADSGARTLVIGLGSGITAAAALAGGAGPTEVVELEPAVVSASRFFHAAGENPLDDPRVTLVLGDARTHLELGEGRYGLIVSEPSNPWIAGVNNLFTVDFYRRVRRRLAGDGVFCQWMQLYELSPATFSSMVASFLEVFPEGHAFVVWKNVDLLLVAAPPGRGLDLGRLGRPAALRTLARAGIPSPIDLAAYYSASFAELRRAAGKAPLNRDDRPIVEYRAPRDLVEIGRSAPGGNPRVTERVPFAARPPDGPLFAEWDRGQWYEARALRLARLREEALAFRTVRAARDAGYADLSARLESEVAAELRRQRGLELVDRAQTLIATGERAEGRRLLEQATHVDPDNGRTWVMLADQFQAAGDLERADRALVNGRASPDSQIRSEAAIVTGLVEMRRERPLAAAVQFAEAQRFNPLNPKPYILEARAHWAAGDTAAARRALARGSTAVPGDDRFTTEAARFGARR